MRLVSYIFNDYDLAYKIIYSTRKLRQRAARIPYLMAHKLLSIAADFSNKFAEQTPCLKIDRDKIAASVGHFKSTCPQQFLFAVIQFCITYYYYDYQY